MATTATTVPLYTVLRFTQVSGRQARHVWLKSASYAAGLGSAVKRIEFTTDRAQAARFSLMSAHAIGVQFHNRYIVLERPDGTPMPEATAALQAEQETKHAEYRRVRAEIMAWERELAAVMLKSLTGLTGRR